MFTWAMSGANRGRDKKHIRALKLYVKKKNDSQRGNSDNRGFREQSPDGE